MSAALGTSDRRQVKGSVSSIICIQNSMQQNVTSVFRLWLLLSGLVMWSRTQVVATPRVCSNESKWYHDFLDNADLRLSWSLSCAVWCEYMQLHINLILRPEGRRERGICRRQQANWPQNMNHWHNSKRLARYILALRTTTPSLNESRFSCKR